MEVGFVDLRDASLRIEEGAYERLFRDHFSKYENPSFLAEGGWKTASADASSDGLLAASGVGTKKTTDSRIALKDGVAGFRVLIDNKQFASKPRAMRLEPESEEPSRSIAKQVSFPVRVPFAVSADSFTIAGNDVGAIEASVSGLKVEALKNNGRERTVTLGSRRTLTREPREKRTGLSASSGDNAGGTQPASGGAAKTMSASPAGGSFYIYSFDGRLLAEYNLYGECVRDYIYMGGQLVAEYRPSTYQYLYYMSDQINSTRVVTDDTGNVAYSAAYDPYGGVQQTWVNTFDPALKFSGKERDGESGLDYFGARYYDKSQYRFISADPTTYHAASLGMSQLRNLYAYCGDNPISFIDPDGKQTNIYVLRTNYSDTSTTGTLWAGNKCLGTTWELPWRDNEVGKSCIFEGVYQAVLRFRDDIGWVIELENEHGRTWIQIHVRGDNNEGCITLDDPRALLVLLGIVLLQEPLGYGARLENRGGGEYLPTKPITVSVGSVPGLWGPYGWSPFPEAPASEKTPSVKYWYRVVGYVD